MIDRPGLEVQMAAADQFSSAGPLAERITRFAQRWQRNTGLELPSVHLTARGSLRDHVGLGCGTQLGLAVGTLLSKAAQYPLPDLATLSGTVDRARRSAVGCYGFLHGGFLLEMGHRPEQAFPELAYREELPAGWRFVLAIQRQVQGRHGKDEELGFRHLPQVPPETTRRMLQWVQQEMIPGLQAQDVRRFGEAIYEYGALAGDCYAALQQGRYANRLCTQLVHEMRQFGIAGVGQSSWGPTIFGLCQDAQEAEALSAHLRERYSESELHLEVAAPKNDGARLEGTQLSS